MTDCARRSAGSALARASTARAASLARSAAAATSAASRSLARASACFARVSRSRCASASAAAARCSGVMSFGRAGSAGAELVMGPNSWSQPDMLCANAASAGGRDAGRGGRSDAAPSARGVADGFRFSSVGLGRVLAAEVSAGSVGRGLSAGFSLTEFSLLSGFSLPPAAPETARERWRGRSSSLWSDARASAATDARDRFALSLIHI